MSSFFYNCDSGFLDCNWNKSSDKLLIESFKQNLKYIFPRSPTVYRRFGGKHPNMETKYVYNRFCLIY